MKPSSNPPQSGSIRPENTPEARRAVVVKFLSELHNPDHDKNILTDYLYYDQVNPLAMTMVLRERYGERFDQLAYAVHQLTEATGLSFEEVSALIKEELDHMAVAALENADTEQAAVVSARAAMTDVANHGPVDPYGRTHISSNPPASSPLPPASPRPAEAAPSVADRREVLLRSYLFEALNDELRAAVYGDVTAVQLSQPMNKVTIALLQRMQESGLSYDDARGMVARIIGEGRQAEAAPSPVTTPEGWVRQYLHQSSRSERGIIYADVMSTQQKRTMNPVTTAVFQAMEENGVKISFEEAKALIAGVLDEDALTMQIAQPAILGETPPVPKVTGFVRRREEGKDITQSPWGGAKPAPAVVPQTPVPAAAPRVVNPVPITPTGTMTPFTVKGAGGNRPLTISPWAKEAGTPEASESPWANEVDRILFKRVEAWVGKMPVKHRLMLLDVLELDPDDREQVTKMVTKYGPADFAELAQLHEGLRTIARETRSPFKHLAQFVPIILDGGQILESVPLQPGQKQKDVRTVISPRKKQ